VFGKRNEAHVQFNRVIGLFVLSASSVACSAQYRLLPGEANSDGCLPTTPARICLGHTGTEHCYTPPNDKSYVFGLEPKALAVGQLNGHELTLFSSMFYGCGSGTLTSYALLTVNHCEFVNLLPEVELTNQSEFKLWNLPQFSHLPVLVTADFIWEFEAGETHFAPHRYRIEAFVFNAKSGRYLQRVRYETTKKYPGLDEVDEIRVLTAERPTILGNIGQSQPN
jgi:hypothetical protein